LDRETAGLVLLARTQDAFDSLLAQQNAGLLVKEYEALALAVPAPKLPLGFPLRVRNKKIPSVIESAFRPYGPGSKAVRPVPLSASDREASRRETAPYRTMVLESTLDREYRWFSLRLFRGFRHQIRCHLAWIGYPLLNDALYGGPQAALPGGGIALDAQGLSFTDPCTGEKRYYRL
jgi:23S rRNA pseudouridine1911/1915/1917 synthase